MTLSRLALAAMISLRAVLVYGEATSAATAELTWRELLPARWRVPHPRFAGPRAELIREVPS
jgi:allantoicase